MRMNILRQVSKTSELQVGRLSSREGEDLLEEDEKEDNTPTRKISTASLFNMVQTHTPSQSHPVWVSLVFIEPKFDHCLVLILFLT